MVPYDTRQVGFCVQPASELLYLWTQWVEGCRIQGLRVKDSLRSLGRVSLRCNLEAVISGSTISGFLSICIVYDTPRPYSDH